MIKVNTDKIVRVCENFWNHIHFHPTDAIEDEWGQRILNEVAKDGVAETVRMYNMLEDIVKQDENGNIYYDYTENDVRMDYIVNKGFNILLINGYIPPFMAVNPSLTSSVSKNKKRYKGKMIITSQPKDYRLWEEICYNYAKHITERYGNEVVSKWYIECWNEPDINLFFLSDLPEDEAGTKTRLTEYLKLYRGFIRGMTRANPNLQLGGPTLALKLDFLEGFLKTVKEENLKLDFISVHTYGTGPVELNNGTAPFNPKNTLIKQRAINDVIVRYFPNTPVFVDEWGASSHGFYNRDECPALMFREGSEYAAYMGKMICAYIESGVKVDKMMICLSGQHEMTVDFSGFRNLFTLNFIKKPIYNAFLLLAKLFKTDVESTGGDKNTVHLATKEGGKVSVMLAYSSENFNEELPKICETLKFEGISGKKTVSVWLIDESHTNPYKLCKRCGWGDDYDEKMLALLKEEGNLKPLSVRNIDFDECDEIKVEMENNALAIIEIV